MFNVMELGINVFALQVDVLVVSSVRSIENGNSQLEHEKVCLRSFCLFMIRGWTIDFIPCDARMSSQRESYNYVYQDSELCLCLQRGAKVP